MRVDFYAYNSKFSMLVQEKPSGLGNWEQYARN